MNVVLITPVGINILSVDKRGDIYRFDVVEHKFGTKLLITTIFGRQAL
jgi:hypothetical protein